MQIPVVIVGGGLAGLTCALELERRGVDYRLLEAGSEVGGRVRTDVVEGFRLDRGFQVLLTAYPEIRRLWNYQQLRLRPLASGARIRHQGSWLLAPDPLRQPGQAWAALTSPVGSLSDKLRLAALGLASFGFREPGQAQESAGTAREFLRRWGFSAPMIELFWRPFFGGVLLDDELQASSSLLAYLFSLFVRGRVALPAQGMGQLPLQLERRLSPGKILLQRRVVRLQGRECWDDQGQHWQPEHLVLAVEASSAAQLGLGLPPALIQEPEAKLWKGTHCSYFAAPASPGGGGMLHLNSDRGSCLHHLLVISDSVPEYAPPGESLISVSSQQSDCPSPQQLLEELRQWFGPQVERWRLLRQYSLPQALPRQPLGRPALHLGEGLWRCGDYLAYGSLNAAVKTGRQVAESLGYGPPA